MSEKILFSEKQRFNQPLIWIIVWAIWIFISWGFIEQVILGNAFGNNPVPDFVLWMVWVLATGMLLLFLTVRMEFKIYPHFFVYRFKPLHKKERRIYFTDVYCWKVVKYSPLINYGGWGVRFSFTEGYAFSVRGNWGLKLRLMNGHRMLIGSQKPEEIRNVLHQITELEPCHDVHIR